MASPPVLFLKNIRLTFGATPLLTGADLTVGEGDRITLVGRNGSGKSTLLKIAAGLVEADDGERFFQPGKTVRYLRQEPDLSAFTATSRPPRCRAAKRGGRRSPMCWRRSRTSCCSTSRPTTSTCRPSSGWKASLPR